ncbi:DUF1674 domain-containing protein [Methylomicrobium lacus]|uniref:DUF1674 domain-containing protein n=1 Tax=Methylomicrobium lacus TaxID=136992 RepID=UPI0035A826B2
MMTEQSTFHPEQHERPEPTGSQQPGFPLSSSPSAEVGGFAGPEPTRYGDWEKNGRCIDF